jgi:aminoglycoside phosphotransferase (APT) family kinase protein
MEMDPIVTRKYSERLGTLSDAQLQAALDRFQLGQLVRAEPISAGNFGQNLFLTSTTGEYVLRGAPFYPHQFPQERFFTRQLYEWTHAPVPWPYLRDPSDAIFGWSYVIMPRMPGMQLSDPEVRAGLSGADRLVIARAMGETLAEMHRLTWPTPGTYDLASDTIQPFETNYAGWAISLIRECIEAAIPLSDRTTDADVAWVEAVIARNRPALDVPFRPCFVNMDYKEENVVVQRVGPTWRVSGVFDYMDAHFGDGELDLARCVAVYSEADVALARAFVRTYTHLRPLRPGFAGRFQVYMLVERLLCWQFGQRHGVWWQPDLTLREWVEPYVSLEVF